MRHTTCQEGADVCGHEHVEGFVESVDGAGEEGADGGAHRASPVDDRRHRRQRLRGATQARVGALHGRQGRHLINKWFMK